jgi:hypothetical protein
LEELEEVIQGGQIRIIEVCPMAEQDASALHHGENVNLCLWWRGDSPDYALMVSIAHSVARLCIHSSNSVSGRAGRIANQTTSAMPEVSNVGTELTEVIGMGYINSESSYQWACPSIWLLHSVDAWNFLIEGARRSPRCPPAPVPQNRETG